MSETKREYPSNNRKPPLHTRFKKGLSAIRGVGPPGAVAYCHQWTVSASPTAVETTRLRCNKKQGGS
jgi:hypothetical protein